MSNKFVGEDRSVDFDFNKINGHCWDFSEYSSAEGVSEGEVNVAQGEVNVVGGGLEKYVNLEGHIFKQDDLPLGRLLEVPPHQRPYCRSP